MISFLINLSMPWTCFSNVSMIIVFMDTFYGRVHAVDMNGKNQPAVSLCAFISTNREELGYGW
jgi:hypothetical protein